MNYLVGLELYLGLISPFKADYTNLDYFELDLPEFLNLSGSYLAES